MHDNRRVLPRFYAPNAGAASTFPLPFDEARHLTRVLRLGSGAEIEVFDGHGSVWRAVVVDAARDRATARIIQQLPAPAAPSPAITVVQAVLKAGSMDDAVRDATMMGAGAIQPVLTEHVAVRGAYAQRDANRDRWMRVALAAVKQSRRSTLPEIPVTQVLEEWLTSAPAEQRLIFVEPSTGIEGQSLRSLREAPDAVSVLLGPEGGWSPHELAIAVDAGCTPVSLGRMTIRAESMPVAALAAIWAVWGR